MSEDFFMRGRVFPRRPGRARRTWARSLFWRLRRAEWEYVWWVVKSFSVGCATRDAEPGPATVGTGDTDSGGGEV